jgi:hypothetical protein
MRCCVMSYSMAKSLNITRGQDRIERRHRYTAIRSHASLGYRGSAPEILVAALATWPATRHRNQLRRPHFSCPPDQLEATSSGHLGADHGALWTRLNTETFVPKGRTSRSTAFGTNRCQSEGREWSRRRGQGNYRGEDWDIVIVVVKAKDSTRDATGGQEPQTYWQVREWLLNRRRHVLSRRRLPRRQIGSHKIAWRKWIDGRDAADRNITPVRISDPGGCAIADHNSITRL